MLSSGSWFSRCKWHSQISREANRLGSSIKAVHDTVLPGGAAAGAIPSRAASRVTTIINPTPGGPDTTFQPGGRVGALFTNGRRLVDSSLRSRANVRLRTHNRIRSAALVAKSFDPGRRV